MIYKPHLNCRVCGSAKLVPYLDLGELPLSNNLAVSSLDPIHNQLYPLKVLFCENCGLSQLSVVVAPEILFSHYVYRSGISRGYVNHCRFMALDLRDKFGLNKGSFHIDIAGNDCTLLEQFKQIIGCQILNVDPAGNLAGICEAIGVPTLTYFWGMDVARRIVNAYGKADIITATNVFAHVDDVKGFLEAVKWVLKPTGVLVMEFPYLIDFIQNKEFDTVYFEHLSYFSIFPLMWLCNSVGLTLMNVEKQDIHGGSVRVTIGFGKEDATVNSFIANELEYRTLAPYEQFSKDVAQTIHNFREWCLNCKGLVAGFAASAKGNTLLNCAGITCGSMKYIVDQTPEKVGKYSPGTRIPIVSIMDMMRNPPDYLVVLSWNFFDEIRKKCVEAGYKGRFVIPIPELTIIENDGI